MEPVQSSEPSAKPAKQSQTLQKWLMQSRLTRGRKEQKQQLLRGEAEEQQLSECNEEEQMLQPINESEELRFFDRDIDEEDTHPVPKLQ